MSSAILRFPRKLTAVVTAACFIFSFVAAPALQAAFTPAGPVAAMPLLSVPVLGIPSDAGRITASSVSGNTPPLVVIQDLHCHPEVQKNIVRILSRLDKDYGIKNIYLEGAYGDVSTGWLAVLKKTDLGKKVLDAELNRGWLDGAEYYSIMSGKTGIIKGLENKRVYEENIHRLNLMMDQRAAVRPSLEAMKRECAVLQERYFSRGNAALARLKKRNENGSMSSKIYYSRLIRLADKAFIDMSRFPDIVHFNALVKSGDRLSFPRAVSELQKVMARFRAVLPYQEYQHIASMAGDNDRRDEFMVLVTETARHSNIDIASDYPHLAGLVAYQSRQAKVNPQLLIREENALLYELHHRFVASPAEQEVVFISEFARLIEDILFNRVTAQDYAWYAAHTDEFNAAWPRYSRLSGADSLKDMLTLSRDFYTANIERNEYFLDAIISGSLSSKQNSKEVNVVIAGGFHTDGLARMLREKNISHIVITPAVTTGTVGSTRLYEELIRSQNTVSVQTIADLAKGLCSPESLCNPIAQALVIQIREEGILPGVAANTCNDLLAQMRIERKDTIPLFKVSEVVNQKNGVLSFVLKIGDNDPVTYNVSPDGSVSRKSSEITSASVADSVVMKTIDKAFAGKHEWLSKLVYVAYTVIGVNWESVLLLPIIGPLVSNVLDRHGLARSIPEGGKYSVILSAAAAGLLLFPDPSIKLLCFFVAVVFSAAQFYSAHPDEDSRGNKKSVTLFAGSMLISAGFWIPLLANALGIPLPVNGMLPGTAAALYTSFVASFIIHFVFNAVNLIIKSSPWARTASLLDKPPSFLSKISFPMDALLTDYKEKVQEIVQEAVYQTHISEDHMVSFLDIGVFESSIELSMSVPGKSSIGINSAVFKIKDENLRDALVYTGLYHEFCRQLMKDKISDFEQEQRERDVDYFIKIAHDMGISPLELLRRVPVDNSVCFYSLAMAVEQSCAKLSEQGDLVKYFQHDFNNAITPILAYASMLDENNNLVPATGNLAKALADYVKLREPDFHDRNMMMKLISETGHEFENALSVNEVNLNDIIHESQSHDMLMANKIYLRHVLSLVFPEFDKHPEKDIAIGTMLKELSHVDKTGTRIEIEVELPNDPCMVKGGWPGAEAALFCAMANIIINAKENIKIKKIENPSIKISVQLKKDKIAIIISDNGGGIDKEKIDTIFNPGVTTKGEGRGLGMAFVKKLVGKFEEGSIGVENIKGNDNQVLGACFTISLPAARSKIVEAPRNADMASKAKVLDATVIPGAFIRVLAQETLLSQGPLEGKTVVLVPGRSDRGDYKIAMDEYCSQGAKVVCFLPQTAAKGELINLSDNATSAGVDGRCFDIMAQKIDGNSDAWAIYYPDNGEDKGKDIAATMKAVFNDPRIFADNLGIDISIAEQMREQSFAKSPEILSHVNKTPWVVILAPENKNKNDKIAGTEFRVAQDGDDVTYPTPVTAIRKAVAHLGTNPDMFAAEINDLAQQGIDTFVLSDVENIEHIQLQRLLEAARVKCGKMKILFYCDIPASIASENKVLSLCSLGIDGVRINTLECASDQDRDIVIETAAQLNRSVHKIYHGEQVKEVIPIVPLEASEKTNGMRKVVVVQFDEGMTGFSLPKAKDNNKDTWVEIRKKDAGLAIETNSFFEMLFQQLSHMECGTIGFDEGLLPLESRYQYLVKVVGEHIAQVVLLRTPEECYAEGRKKGLIAKAQDVEFAENITVISSFIEMLGKHDTLNMPEQDKLRKGSSFWFMCRLSEYESSLERSADDKDKAQTAAELHGFLDAILGRAMRTRTTDIATLESAYEEILVWALARGGVKAGKFDGNIDNLIATLQTLPEGKTPPAPGSKEDLLKECDIIRSLDKDKISSEDMGKKVKDLVTKLHSYSVENPSSPLEIAELLWLLKTFAPPKIKIDVTERKLLLQNAIHSLLSAA